MGRNTILTTAVTLAALTLPCLASAQAGPEPSSHLLEAMSDAGRYLVAWTASEAGGSEQTVFLKNISKNQEITITTWEIYDCNNLAGKGCGAHDEGPTLKPGKTVRLVTVRRRESRGGYSYKYRFSARWSSDTTTTSP